MQAQPRQPEQDRGQQSQIYSLQEACSSMAMLLIISNELKDIP